MWRTVHAKHDLHSRQGRRQGQGDVRDCTDRTQDRRTDSVVAGKIGTSILLNEGPLRFVTSEANCTPPCVVLAIAAVTGYTGALKNECNSPRMLREVRYETASVVTARIPHRVGGRDRTESCGGSQHGWGAAGAAGRTDERIRFESGASAQSANWLRRRGRSRIGLARQPARHCRRRDQGDLRYRAGAGGGGAATRCRGGTSGTGGLLEERDRL